MVKKIKNWQGVAAFFLGAGLGTLLTYPVFGSHPLRWGLGLMVVGILIYFYSVTTKK
jgi:hypothetical protein